MPNRILLSVGLVLLSGSLSQADNPPAVKTFYECVGDGKDCPDRSTGPMPPRVIFALVEAVGGGGAGGGGAANGRYGSAGGGGGGAAGQYAFTQLSVKPGDVLVLSPGLGGTSNGDSVHVPPSGSSGRPGTAGGASQIRTSGGVVLLTVSGGLPGSVGTYAPGDGDTGGAGGVAGDNTAGSGGAGSNTCHKFYCLNGADGEQRPARKPEALPGMSERDGKGGKGVQGGSVDNRGGGGAGGGGGASFVALGGWGGNGADNGAPGRVGAGGGGGGGGVDGGALNGRAGGSGGPGRVRVWLILQP